MVKKLFIMFLVISSPVFAKTNPKDNLKKDNINYSKVITVHGMVCAFCSNSVEKKLKKEKAIDQVKVNLTNKKISVYFKKDQSIEDEKLKKIITSSGFKVVQIESLSKKPIKTKKDETSNQK